MSGYISKVRIQGQVYDLGFGDTTVEEAVERAEAAADRVDNSAEELDEMEAEATALKAKVDPLVEAFEGSSAADVEEIIENTVETKLAEELPTFPLSIANGGTGAGSVASARTALGIFTHSYTEYSVTMSLSTENGNKISLVPSTYKFSESSLLAVQLLYAWPQSSWSNGAIVSIAEVEFNDATGKLDIYLTTNSAQSYALTFRFLFIS